MSCNHNHECSCHHHEHQHHSECGCNHKHTHFKKLIIRGVITVTLMIIALYLESYLKYAVLIASYIVIAYDVLINSFKHIIKGKIFDENLLMSLASLTALIVPMFTNEAHIDQFDGILVILLYQIGEYIQHKAVDKSKENITKMLDLEVEVVTVLVEGKYIERCIEEIKVDDIVVIKPGEKIVVDGIVVEGNSTINTASLTGESLPVDVVEGSKILSGSINNDGLILLKAISTFNNSTTAKVKEVVENATKNKGKIDLFFTKFAKVYTPVVIGVSLFIMFILPLFFGFEEHFLTFLYKGLAVMVISCPCALVISIPLSYFMGIGKAASNQILIKGASYLEILSEIDTIVFDKTGTLTKGEFRVVDIKGTDILLMKQLLYSVEKNFTHAIALSITNYLSDQDEVKITELTNVLGYGVKAVYNGATVLIGNSKLLEKYNIAYEKINSDLTTIYVSYNNIFLGYVTIVDELKNGAVNAINELLNSYNIHIISGDKKDSVKRVSEYLNITNYHYELLPNDKLEVLNKIRENHKVIYVGDGINDAACLLQAYVGVSVGVLGSDIAVSASDIVLMDDSIENINKMIKISKKMKRIIIGNIIFSLTVKFSVIILALFINIPMSIAIVADVGVALIAVLNSLRIMFGKIK